MAFLESFKDKSEAPDGPNLSVDSFLMRSPGAWAMKTALEGMPKSFGDGAGLSVSGGGTSTSMLGGGNPEAAQMVASVGRPSPPPITHVG